MKIRLIYSKTDQQLGNTFITRTIPLVNEGKIEFVSEQADCALLLISLDLLNDVFCYQEYLTAKHFKRLISPVLMKYCLDKRAKYEEMLQLTWQGKYIPYTGNYIYNPDGSFRSGNYTSLDRAWEITLRDLKHFIEANRK